jgi:diacylglycerol kinase (ATP)
MPNNSFEMEKVKVLHNPGAGDGETSKRELIREIESAGFKCSYSSTKQFRWENIETEDFGFLVLAGGDGTVRKIAENVLAQKVIQKKLPIGLLPMGTANNIARTLGIGGQAKNIIQSWHQKNIKKFDVGKIAGLKEPAFFLESFGYGLFPKLMQEMKRQKKNSIENPKEKLRTALEVLRDLIQEATSRECKLEIDGTDHSGEYLLIEVMNIRSIGPNLNLAPDADPGDGAFEVVLISEKQRDGLAEYVEARIDGTEVPFDFPIVRARQLKIFWDGRHLHVDDEYYKLEKPVNISVELREGLLEFLLPHPVRA